MPTKGGEFEGTWKSGKNSISVNVDIWNYRSDRH